MLLLVSTMYATSEPSAICGEKGANHNTFCLQMRFHAFFNVKTLRKGFTLKYCSIIPLCEHGEESLAWCHVRAAAVSGHKHHMLPTTNRLQSHPTVKCRLRDLLCCYPFVQHMAAESSQSCASSSVGQPSVHHSLAFTGLASEGGSTDM